MPDIFLHIGLHKTATTTLQKQLFPAWINLNYISNSNIDMVEFVDLAITCDPIYFDKDKARKLISTHFDSRNPNLISSEGMSGSLYDGVTKYDLDHRSPIIRNLKEALPEAHIILVIRRQDGLSRSIYRQYLKEGGTESIKKFYSVNKNSPGLITLNRFKYSPYIDELVNSFPAGILILTLEEFTINQKLSLQKLSDFIGIDALNIKLKKSNQTSLGTFGVEFSRILNHFFYSKLNPGGLLKGIPKSFRNGKINWSFPSGVLHDRWPIKKPINKNSYNYKISKKILESVKEDNRVLDQRYNLDLEKYGYY